ncbi:hypothetical protein MNKW57_04410 [Biformimicrobium ophioploci]|uniref:Peptidase S9A N-terminal domain-containing protein n=1 Tax=Biformimicrobium ophioploci TaxID=3036711 RepID=A0ABQ6LVL9_9GAMM|nr:hypothetical protein MNKW57_04410 [Microbulbifer sp. NKW57]
MKVFRQTYRAVLALIACSFSYAEEDPYLWLEEIESERAIEWVKKQNRVTDSRLTDTPLYKGLYQDALAALDAEDRLPEVTQKGEWLYQNYHSKANPRGLYRRIKVVSFNRGEDSWETVLDIDALSKKEGKK